MPAAGDHYEAALYGKTPDAFMVEPNQGSPRAGWAKAFKEMAAEGDDALLDGDVRLSTLWEDEWQWQ